MKIPVLIFILISLWLCGCSRNDHHDFNRPGKIPIDARRWYQLNNTTKGLEQLFNGKEYEKPNTGDGTVLENYDAYYPVLPGEQMTIDSIMFFDWEGTNRKHPMTIYAIMDNWQRVPIAVFTGSRYNAWVGPDPNHPDVFVLRKPVSDIRYLVLNSWGDFPGEIEFYGTYTPPLLLSRAVKKPAPLKNFFGVNAFEWNFEDPKNPLVLDATRLPAIKSFTGIRHYMDWVQLEPAQGHYTFNPVKNGNWNYDTMYRWCKDQGIEVLACLKTVPPWLLESYPKDERDNENVPARYGKDLSDPASYMEQARAAFQYAARYGNNKNVDVNLLSADTAPLWQNGPKNQVKAGMGLIRYIECDNERDKWWKGRKAYQTGREYAANLSAFYDGNKGKMGPGVGVKTADPEMNVVMAGLASPNTDYVRGMIDWSIEFRGRKQDGRIDLPWDVINYHYYNSDKDYTQGRKQTTGAAPELTKAATTADNFIQMAHQYADDMPVWITETGYDINPNSSQKAISVNNKTALETQADWILRTSLLYARSGIQKVFFYELPDDNAGSDNNFATSGLINQDKTRRPAADFLYQTNKLFGEYTCSATINNSPVVDRYTFNNHTMYMLVAPTQEGKTRSYTVDLENGDSAYVYTPKAGSNDMSLAKKKTINGKVEIIVSETPVFVTSFNVVGTR